VQAVDSKRERETGGRGAFRNPVWNQDFQFLVEDGPSQSLRITIYDSPYTGRAEVRFFAFAS
jgi:C2 domain